VTATALVGAQHGSEGKGVIASVLAGRFDVAVRTGGPNAGHSIWHEGKVYKMRGVPCAWINPECELLIGAGAVVDLDLLADELRDLPGVVVRVDTQAVVVTHDMQREEQGMWAKIGSTQEGVGIARIRKIERDAADKPLMRDAVLGTGDPWDRIVPMERTAQWLYGQLLDGANVMLEGTQGSALSLHHGDWPYCTSADTNAAQLLADAGIAPRHLRHTYLVARTYPIRVAGNSGPMAYETSWERLGFEPETTTVTNRVRRVGEWDRALYERAVALNGPCGTFLTFADYIAPELRGSTSWAELGANPAISALVGEVEDISGAPVLGLGTGPDASGAWQVATASPRCAHGEYWRE